MQAPDICLEQIGVSAVGPKSQAGSWAGIPWGKELKLELRWVIRRAGQAAEGWGPVPGAQEHWSAGYQPLPPQPRPDLEVRDKLSQRHLEGSRGKGRKQPQLRREGGVQSPTGSETGSTEGLEGFFPGGVAVLCLARPCREKRQGFSEQGSNLNLTILKAGQILTMSDPIFLSLSS